MKAKIVEMLKQGKDKKEISYEVGCALSYVYRIQHTEFRQKTMKKNEKILQKLIKKFQDSGFGNKSEGFAITLMNKFESKRVNAGREEVEFTLNLLDLDIPKVCPALKIPLNYQGFGKQNDNISFDRVDPKKGYTNKNTRIISWAANRKKQDSTIQEMLDIIDYIKINS